MSAALLINEVDDELPPLTMQLGRKPPPTPNAAEGSHRSLRYSSTAGDPFEGVEQSYEAMLWTMGNRQ
jgi:hypothetical protein